jgi:hypothetical protein
VAAGGDGAIRVYATTELEPDAVFRDARRRAAIVFRLNIALAVAIAIILMSTITAGIIVGFLGQEAPAAALGGAALLDLIGAAVYRPLAQIDRAWLNLQHVDIVILTARERLRSAAAVKDPIKRATAVRKACSTILDEIGKVGK